MEVIDVVSVATLAKITLGLFIMALVGAGFALLYRRRGRLLDERRRSLVAEWDPKVMALLFDWNDGAARALTDSVWVGDRLMFIGNLLRFARRLSGPERDRIKRLALPLLPAVAQRLSSRSAPIRARAVQTLGELGWPEYTNEVVAALDDEAPLVCMMSAQELCCPQGADYVDEVLARLDRLTAWTPRFLASTLAAVGSEGAMALRKALADDTRDTYSRTAVAEALRHLNDFSAAPIAAAVVEKETDREVVAASLRLLGHVGSSDHLEAVRGRARDDDFVIRVAAADALAALGGADELEQLRLMVYDDQSQWVALRAARSLLQAGWRAELRALALSSHPRAAIGSQVLAEGSAR